MHAAITAAQQHAQVSAAARLQDRDKQVGVLLITSRKKHVCEVIQVGVAVEKNSCQAGCCAAAF